MNQSYNDSEESMLSKIVTAIAIGVLFFIGFYVIGIYLLLSFYYILPIFIVLMVIIYVFILRKVFTWKAYNKVWVISSIVLVSGAIAYAGSLYYNDSIRITQNQVHVDLSEYEPFMKGSKAAKLDTEASLQLEGPLLKIDGATALYPVYASFVQAVYPEGTYDAYDSIVASTQTGNAYNRLLSDKVDLIFAAGPSERHEQLAEDKGKELQLTPIGKEAFVFFVNQKNKIKNLSMTEIKQIYSGEITNWKDVGGKNQQIEAYQREEDSGSQTAMQQFMGDTRLMDPLEENTISLMGGIIDEVADYKNSKKAIGYTFRYYSTTMIGEKNIRLLDIDGVSPTIEHIQDDSYPISSEFYIVTAGSSNPNLEPFIEWVLSSEGQKLVEQSGYVPLAPIE